MESLGSWVERSYSKVGSQPTMSRVAMDSLAIRIMDVLDGIQLEVSHRCGRRKIHADGRC